MKYINSSELSFGPIQFNKEPVYLCKVCQNDWTTNEDGICNECKERFENDRSNLRISGLTHLETEEQMKANGFDDFYEFMDFIEQDYINMENILIVNDGDNNNINDDNVKDILFKLNQQQNKLRSYLETTAFENELNKLKNITKELEETRKTISNLKKDICRICKFDKCGSCRLNYLLCFDFEKILRELKEKLSFFKKEDL